jgi:nitric oxide reductase subunit C
VTKQLILFVLAACFIMYSSYVYVDGTAQHAPTMTAAAVQGKLLFQKHNCIACHQIYGLGGYLGPELTTVISNPARGELLARAIIQSGTSRMPQFNLRADEINQLIEFLKYVDETAVSYK